MWLAQPNPTTLDAKIPYRVNTPKLTQVVIGKDFHYFKIKLHDIDRFFTTKKSWNRDYGPAQQIYSDNVASEALRSAIAAEHTILYSGREGRDGNMDGFLDRTPEAFFDLLEKYRDTRSSSVVGQVRSALGAGINYLSPRKDSGDQEIYTYVLSDTSLRFSRSGAGMRVDMSSKHALHAGAAPEVYYAGEFWIEMNTEPGCLPTKVLYLDNNSGTFAPPGAELFRLSGLMQYNFPGIPIEIIDYQDPRWKTHRNKE